MVYNKICYVCLLLFLRIFNFSHINLIKLESCISLHRFSSELQEQVVSQSLWYHSEFSGGEYLISLLSKTIYFIYNVQC